MIQQALFAKSTKFRRPKRTTSRYGDVRREWWTTDRTGLVVESRGIAGIAMPRHYHAIIVTPTGQALVSRHKKLKPALAAVVKATEQKSTVNTRRKSRRCP